MGATTISQMPWKRIGVKRCTVIERDAIRSLGSTD